jgi:hypothetical protein
MSLAGKGGNMAIAIWGHDNAEWEASLESIRFRAGSCEECNETGHYPIACNVTMKFRNKTGLGGIRVSDLRLLTGREGSVFVEGVYKATHPTECVATGEPASIGAIFTLLAYEARTSPVDENPVDVFNREKLGFEVKMHGRDWILLNSGVARKAEK